MTWSKDQDLELFWPLKFLPFEKDISDARILTFGYSTNLKAGGGKSRMSVLDFAKILLGDLKHATDDERGEELGIGEVRAHRAPSYLLPL
jgi:hypothetical protein